MSAGTPQALARALLPLTSRVRTDVTAVKLADGAQAWTRKPLTTEALLSHVVGERVRGVCPIKAGESTTMVGMLDFDSHKGEATWAEVAATARDVIDSIELMGGAPVAWRSSGGRGIHVFVLWDKPQDAHSVRVWLGQVLASCGLRNGTAGVKAKQVEIFPKQDSVPVGGFGNQFVLPLAGASVPLADGTLHVLDRADAVGVKWGISEPVPVISRADRKAGASADSGTSLDVSPELRELVDAIPNAGENTLAYDAWRNVVFAIHHETGGSDAGLALAHEFSARSGKYEPKFLDDRVWPYVSSDRGGGVVIGIGTLRHLAAQFGWTRHASVDDFDDVSSEDERPPVSGHPFDWTESNEESTNDQAPGSPAGGRSAGHVTPLDVGGAGVETREITHNSHDDISQQTEDADASTDDEPPPDDARAGGGDRGGGGSADGRGDVGVAAGAGAAGPDRDGATAVGAGSGEGAGGESGAARKRRRRGIPEAQHLTTDQANAGRLVRSFGNQVLVAASKWHTWDGRRWVCDESDVYRFGCRLSEVIHEEARGIRARARENPDPAAIKKADELAGALDKWAARSEMKGAIEAAIGLGRKMLGVAEDSLNADPWLLNCPNGTVDLRTGVMKKHDAADYITRLAGARYVVGAECPTWERVLDDLFNGDKAVIAYLQRWAGYCLTGVVSEQTMVVHWGGGSNGKSLVVGTLAGIMGDYAGTGAPGLLTATKEQRHPAELAGLFGKRLVTVHESAEGAPLREDLLKQATGGDRITARFLYGEFFEFAPTHKLQLLTNHKPVVKGTDAGIWRRLHLMPYTVSFGTAEEVAAGKRQRVGDRWLADKLRDEWEGILAWAVRGAVEWAREGGGGKGGLRPPDAVLEASERYRGEQDRVRQFVDECCRLGAGELYCEPLTGPMGSGLFPGYQGWCKEGGILPLSKRRFLDELLRVVPGAVQVQREAQTEEGRRKMTMINGIRYLPE